MALPGLKPSLELVEDGAGPRLVNLLTREALALTALEVSMLRAWDGVAGAAAVADALFAQGLSVDGPAVEQFFTRLANLQLLATVAQVSVPVAVAAAVPLVETEGDLVPLLRSDLVITPSPASRGTRDVADPKTGRSFTLYDFEVSIARMLDGRRTAGEVISAANRLGIPVTLVTLRTFLSQLRAYQFIDTEAVRDGDTTWAPRRKWTVEARELYQSALRLLRAGKYEDARSYVDALVAADPENEEVAGLRARIDAEAAGSAELNVPFDTLHTPMPGTLPVVKLPQGTQAEAWTTRPPGSAQPVNFVPPPAVSAPTSPLVDQVPPPEPSRPTTPALMIPDSEPATGQALLVPDPAAPHTTSPETPVARASAATTDPSVPTTDPFASFGFNSAPPPPESLAPLPPSLDDSARPATTIELPQRSKLPVLLTVAAVLVLLGVALGRPVDTTLELPCELKAVPVGEVSAPRDGLVKTALVQSGDAVTKGTLLARLEQSLEETPAAYEAKLAWLDTEVTGLPRPAPAKVAKAKAALKKAQAALKTAEKAEAKAAGAKKAAAKKKVAAAQKSADRAKAALDVLTHEAKRTELKERRAELQAARDEAATRDANSSIEATADGVVLLPELPAEVKEGQLFARLVDSRLTIHTTGEIPGDATKATLKLGHIERPVPVQNGAAHVTLAPELIGAKATLLLPGGRKPYLLKLLGR